MCFISECKGIIKKDENMVHVFYFTFTTTNNTYHNDVYIKTPSTMNGALFISDWNPSSLKLDVNLPNHFSLLLYHLKWTVESLTSRCVSIYNNNNNNLNFTPQAKLQTLNQFSLLRTLLVHRKPPSSWKTLGSINHGDGGVQPFSSSMMYVNLLYKQGPWSLMCECGEIDKNRRTSIQGFEGIMIHFESWSYRSPTLPKTHMFSAQPCTRVRTILHKANLIGWPCLRQRCFEPIHKRTDASQRHGWIPCGFRERVQNFCRNCKTLLFYFYNSSELKRWLRFWK